MTLCAFRVIYTLTKETHKEASKMNGYTENKAARYRLPNTTTMEDLAMEVPGRN